MSFKKVKKLIDHLETHLSFLNSELNLAYLLSFNPFVPNAFSLPPKNIGNPYGFLIFSGSRERVHWEQNGLIDSASAVNIVNPEFFPLKYYLINI